MLSNYGPHMPARDDITEAKQVSLIFHPNQIFYYTKYLCIQPTNSGKMGYDNDLVSIIYHRYNIYGYSH